MATNLIRSALNLASDNILKYVRSKPWHERFLAYYDKMVVVYAEQLSMMPEELNEKLSDHPQDVLFGGIFEDFIQRDFDEAPHNFIDNYLKRRGWKDSAIGREYLRLFRTIPISLYEVVDVDPGKSITVENLIVPSGEIIVTEKAGSMGVKVFDCLAGIVVPLSGEHYFTANILKLHADAANQLANTVKEALQQQGPDLSKTDLSKIALSTITMDDSAMKATVNKILFSYTSAFIAEGLRYLCIPVMPINSSGDPVLPTESHFSVNDAEKVVEVLDGQEEFEGMDTDSNDISWDWLDINGKESAIHTNATLFTYNEDMVSVLGSITLKEETVLKCFTTSKQRAERLAKKLKNLLGDSVGEPLYTYSPLSLNPSKPDPNKPEAEDNTDFILSEEKEAFLKEVLNEHLWQTLDTPIPIFRGDTPREHVKTEKGKTRVVRWLKTLEEHDKTQLELDYEHDWLWEELGLLNEREEFKRTG